MKPLAYVLFALALAGLQAAVLRWMGGGALSAALLAAVVVHLGLHAGNVDGAVAAAGVGYVLDLMSGTPKGLFTFLAVALFLLVRAVGAAVDVRGRAGFAALSGLGALTLSLGAVQLTRYTADPPESPGLRLLGRLLVEAILTGALAPLVGMGMRRLDGLFPREEAGLLR